jgi:hypothetical protein
MTGQPGQMCRWADEGGGPAETCGKLKEHR